MVTRAQAIARLTAKGQPFELELRELYGRPCRTFKNAPPTLRELFEANRSGLDFLVYEDERLSFEDAYQSACKIAALLVEEYGITKGDRVAISMRNYPEWVTSFMAVTSIGAIAVAMNALWQSDEMAYGLSDSGAKVLFADQERLDRLAALAKPPSVKVIVVRRSADPVGRSADPVGRSADLVRKSAAAGEEVRDLEELLAGRPPVAMPRVEFEPTDDAMIVYTSGSTGHPKGAVSCHRNVLSALLSWELDLQAGLLVRGEQPPVLGHQIATLLAVPLFHATGLLAVYLASYRNQRKIVSMYKWDAELAAELVERERITSFTAPAAMTGDLVQTAKATKRDLSSLLTVGGGGAPRAPEQVKQIHQAFANALPGTGWGMTETNAIGTGISGQDYLDRPASSGRCSAVLDLRVVAEDGREIGPGERGELQVRGTSVIRGYWNRPDADAETFTQDGWLRTGDVAYLDDEGFLFIVDRIKDLVIRGGENIGCGQVEAALLEHPQVLEASVYAVPDDRLGEEVGATVYCKGSVDDAELRQFLSGRLAGFEIPRYFDLVGAPLPRIASGKIFKRQIREEAVAKLRARDLDRGPSRET